jgi:hypothetical protein
MADMLSKFIRPVAFHCGNFRYQSHENVEKSSGAGGGRNLYYCEDVYLSVKNVAYTNYTQYSENLFGCHAVSHSSFCIHAYNSTAVNRCFEVDGSNNCSDLYFSHNCENVRDSMFCFNAKNLKNAIGNSQLDPDSYKSLKSSILAQIAGELEKNKSLGWDVFNIGSKKLFPS